MTDIKCEGNALYIEVDGVLLQFSRGGATVLAHRILDAVRWQSSHTAEDIGSRVNLPPGSGLMEMHGEADEHGECLNCANPPHEGPCHRLAP